MADTLLWIARPGSPRLDRALAAAFPQLSRARIQQLIEAGHVTVDGAPARASAKPAAGQEVRVEVPDAVVSEVVAEDVPLDVLHEDDDVLVLVKPAGMVVHPAPGHPGGTLVNALLGRLGNLSTIGGVARPGIVHRLDAGTSGVMVVAKNDRAHRRLSKTFAAHDLDRRYLAVVHRVPLHDGGVIRSELARDPRDRLRFASVPTRLDLAELDEDELEEAASPKRGRPAVTHWRVRARGDRIALVECKLETGRTHQVRVHLSEAGHPIVGDAAYARRDCIAPAGIRARVEALDHPMLHAFHLAFPHPRDGRRIAFTTPPPADFVEVCALAGLPVPAEPLTERAWG
ncbi:MAG: RluA family pseudouridine synthase [Myxococcota bacterium]